MSRSLASRSIAFCPVRTACSVSLPTVSLWQLGLTSVQAARRSSLMGRPPNKLQQSRSPAPKSARSSGRDRSSSRAKAAAAPSQASRTNSSPALTVAQQLQQRVDTLQCQLLKAREEVAQQTRLKLKNAQEIKRLQAQRTDDEKTDLPSDDEGSEATQPPEDAAAAANAIFAVNELVSAKAASDLSDQASDASEDGDDYDDGDDFDELYEAAPVGYATVDRAPDSRLTCLAGVIDVLAASSDPYDQRAGQVLSNLRANLYATPCSTQSCNRLAGTAESTLHFLKKLAVTYKNDASSDEFVTSRRFLQGNVIAVESAISALQPPPQPHGSAPVSRAPGGHFVFAGFAGSAAPQLKAETKRKATALRPTGPPAVNATASSSRGATINLTTSDDELEEDFLVSPPPSKKKAKTSSKVKFYAIYNGSKIGVCRGPWDRPGGPKELTFGYAAPACQKFETFKEAKQAFDRHQTLTDAK